MPDRPVHLAHEHVGGAANEEAVVEHAGEGEQAGIECGGVVDGAEPRVDDPESLIGDDGAVFALPHPQFGHGAHRFEGPHHGRGGHRKHLHRYGHLLPEMRHHLGGIHEHDEAVRLRRDDLFAGVRRTASLDEVEDRADLVGAVEGEVEAFDGLERGERDAVGPGQPFGEEGGGDARDVQPFIADATPDGFDGARRRGAGAEPQTHAVFDQGGDAFAHSLFRGGLSVGHGFGVQGFR